MRKKTIINIADQLFCLIIALLPLIGYGLFMLGLRGNNLDLGTLNNESFITFEQYFLQVYKFDLVNSSVVGQVLRDLFFGDNAILYFGVENIYSTSPSVQVGCAHSIQVILTWFINVEIIHVAVDFILFIPRLCHKFMGRATQSET